MSPGVYLSAAAAVAVVVYLAGCWFAVVDDHPNPGVPLLLLAAFGAAVAAGLLWPATLLWAASMAVVYAWARSPSGAPMRPP